MRRVFFLQKNRHERKISSKWNSVLIDKSYKKKFETGVLSHLAGDSEEINYDEYQEYTRMAE